MEIATEDCHPDDGVTEVSGAAMETGSVSRPKKSPALHCSKQKVPLLVSGGEKG